MKKRVLIFLFTVLPGLMIVPSLNLLKAQHWTVEDLTSQSFLYNMDLALKLASTALFPLGISIDPKQVVIGRNSWLYLGDGHQDTLTTDRRPQTETDLTHARDIRDTSRAWRAYLTGKGVKAFKIMVGPNKATLYPEHLPAWVHPASPNATDALFAETDERIHIDLRRPLKAAKADTPLPLFYKYDTHWNHLGAGIAFRELAQQTSPDAPVLRWPSDHDYTVRKVATHHGGDLANILRLYGERAEPEPIVFALEHPIETVQYDFSTKRVIHQGGNPVVEQTKTPILVQSEGALNHARVLWLRDSYGDALSPFMALTFSQVVQMHWAEAFKDGSLLLRLIEDWQPEYVFVTVVERSARADAFTYLPPSAAPKR